MLAQTATKNSSTRHNDWNLTVDGMARSFCKVDAQMTQDHRTQ
ncbi:hypothetical protein [Polaromonas sp. CG9_12]|nr:hypothetical protein [Polaromonas sp. CG9_12]